MYSLILVALLGGDYTITVLDSELISSQRLVEDVTYKFVVILKIKNNLPTTQVYPITIAGCNRFGSVVNSHFYRNCLMKGNEERITHVVDTTVNWIPDGWRPVHGLTLSPDTSYTPEGLLREGLNPIIKHKLEIYETTLKPIPEPVTPRDRAIRELDRVGQDYRDMNSLWQTTKNTVFRDEARQLLKLKRDYEIKFRKKDYSFAEPEPEPEPKEEAPSLEFLEAQIDSDIKIIDLRIAAVINREPQSIELMKLQEEEIKMLRDQKEKFIKLKLKIKSASPQRGIP